MNKRAVAHYLLCAGILTVYGGRVCPFLDSLSPITLLGSLVTGFLISYCIRYLVFERSMHANPPPGKTSRRFQTEFLLFVTAAAIITIYNSVYYGFPFASCLKLMIGCASLGFFASIDLVLDHEYHLVKKMLKNGTRLTLEKVRTSLARMFTLFPTAGSRAR